jgi:hypothetical protein
MAGQAPSGLARLEKVDTFFQVSGFAKVAKSSKRRGSSPRIDDAGVD